MAKITWDDEVASDSAPITPSGSGGKVIWDDETEPSTPQTPASAPLKGFGHVVWQDGKPHSETDYSFTTPKATKSLEKPATLEQLIPGKPEDLVKGTVTETGLSGAPYERPKTVADARAESERGTKIASIVGPMHLSSSPDGTKMIKTFDDPFGELKLDALKTGSPTKAVETASSMILDTLSKNEIFRGLDPKEQKQVYENHLRDAFKSFTSKIKRYDDDTDIGLEAALFREIDHHTFDISDAESGFTTGVEGAIKVIADNVRPLTDKPERALEDIKILKPTNPLSTRANMVGRVGGPLAAEYALGAGFGSKTLTGLMAIQGLGSALDEGDKNNWTPQQTTGVAIERSIMNALLSRFQPGGKEIVAGSAKELIKDIAIEGSKSTAGMYGTAVGQAGVEGLVKTELGLKDPGALQDMIEAAQNGDVIANAALAGAVHALHGRLDPVGSRAVEDLIAHHTPGGFRQVLEQVKTENPKLEPSDAYTQAKEIYSSQQQGQGPGQMQDPFQTQALAPPSLASPAPAQQSTKLPVGAAPIRDKTSSIARPWTDTVDRLRKLISKGKPNSTIGKAVRLLDLVSQKSKSALTTQGVLAFDGAEKKYQIPNGSNRDALREIPIPGDSSGAFVLGSRAASEPTQYSTISTSAGLQNHMVDLLVASDHVSNYARSQPGMQVGRLPRLLTGDAVAALRSGGGRIFESLRSGLIKLNSHYTPAQVDTILEHVQTKLRTDFADGYKLFVNAFDAIPSGTTIRTGLVKNTFYFMHDNPLSMLKTLRNRVIDRQAYYDTFSGISISDLKTRMDREGIGASRKFEDASTTLQNLPWERPLFDPIRALQNSITGSTPLDWLKGSALRASRVLGETRDLIKSSALTGSSILGNTVELPTGQTMQFFGAKNALRGMQYLAQHGTQGLENLGAINRAFFDWTIQPDHPIQTAFRYARNGMGKVNTVMNELGELHAAAVVKSMGDAAVNRTLPRGDLKKLVGFAKVAGFAQRDINSLLNGSARPELYDRLARRAAPVLTGGNARAGERAILQSSPVFKQLFQFMDYPAMKLRAMDSTLTSVFKDVRQGGINKSIREGSAQAFAKVWIGTAVQGGLAGLLTSLVSGGSTGLKMAIEDDKDKLLNNPVAFIGSLYAQGVGGPVSWAMRSLDQPSKASDVRNYSFTVNLGQDTLEALTGEGSYKELTPLQVASKYMQSRVSGAKLVASWLSIMGLGSRDSDLDLAMKEIQKFKREQGLPATAMSGGDDEDVKFRQMMRAARDMLTKGEDPSNYIKSHLGSEPKSLASSLRGHQLLAGSSIPPDKLERLKKILGPELYAKVQDYDDVLGGFAEQYSVVDEVNKYLGPEEAKKYLDAASPETKQAYKDLGRVKAQVSSEVKRAIDSSRQDKMAPSINRP